MKYTLIGSNDIKNVKETILKNRGVTDTQKYLKLNSTSLHNYSLLSDIDNAVSTLKCAIECNSDIHILVDCDVDGYTSASILYNYITCNMGYKNVYYILQDGKKHGLTDEIFDKLSKHKGLLIIPDAGTNDWLNCERLVVDFDFMIIILDHHQREFLNQHAVIVNNQICNYPNKNLSGVGIVYKFLQALDEEYWTSHADDYLDMVALGNISDSMDLRDCETKYLVDLGMKNISHPLFKAFLNKQSYSIKNIEFPTIFDISFYVTPLINALIRTGDSEEKDLLFQAFIKNYLEFEYTPRKSKNNPNPETICESIYDRVARLCVNAKSRQSKIQEKAVNEIVGIYDESIKNNSIAFVNVSKLENVPNELTGLIAIKIADKYGKPCLILRKDNRSSEDSILFSGSARNINDGQIEDLKSELESSGLFELCAGHSNAFGVSIKKENVPKAIQYFNDKFTNDVEKIYHVDFVFDENIDYKIIKDINNMQNLFSSYVKEPLIAINNVYVDLVGLQAFGDEKKRWSFQNGVIEYIFFNAPNGDEILNIDTFTYSSLIINVVGKVTINTYGNKSTPQVIIQDYEIVHKE